MISNYFFGSKKKFIVGVVISTSFCMYLFRDMFDGNNTTTVSWILLSAVIGIFCILGSLLCAVRFLDFIIEWLQDKMTNEKFIRVFRELWFVNLGWKRLAITLWIILTSILSILIMNDGYSFSLFDLLFSVAVFTVIFWCAVLCINWIINGFVNSKSPNK
jgi:hypothetical protein